MVDLGKDDGFHLKVFWFQIIGIRAYTMSTYLDFCALKKSFKHMEALLCRQSSNLESEL